MRIKVIAFLIMIIFAQQTSAQTRSEKYTKFMYSKIQVLDTTMSKSILESLFSDFNRTAIIEKNDWLSYYYMALTKLRISTFTSEPKLADELLDEANGFLIISDSLNKNNSEIYSLKSRILFTKIPLGNVVERTPKYASIAKTLALRAISLDPNNPRAYLVLGMYFVNLPAFIGGDVKKGCENFKISKQKYSDKKRGVNDIGIYWGEKLLDGMMGACEN